MPEIRGVEVVKDKRSASGYSAVFTYRDRDAVAVNVKGTFSFYQRNDYKILGGGYLLPHGERIDDYLMGSDSWMRASSLRHINPETLTTIPAVKDGDDWKCTVPLPSCIYRYRFEVSRDGKTYEEVIDPTNLPEGGSMSSVFYVPYDYERQDDDWTWVTPMADSSKRGKISYFEYTGVDGTKCEGGIYLPAGYDGKRKEPYKVLYLSHGTGSDAHAWFYSGSAGNIADRQISEGNTESFIIVTMSNDSYRVEDNKSKRGFDWDYETTYRNLTEVIIPKIEKEYNASREPSGRAVAGLSRGAAFANEVYFRDPPAFGYYGFFSGSAAWDWMKWEDISEMKKPKIYLGAGFGDRLLFPYSDFKDMSAVGIKQLFEEFGIPYVDFAIVPGGHDWFTWTQLLRNFIMKSLWK